MKAHSVLVVDDDPDISNAIEIYLRSEGIGVYKASDGEEALQKLQAHSVQLIIMDIMMPGLDGLQTTLEIRETCNVPIIMLSARTEDYDKIVGLNIGADDYIAKPFNPLELMARVKSQLRRFTGLGAQINQSSEDAEHEIQVRGLVYNKQKKTMTLEGEDVRLTPTEFHILRLFMENKGRIFAIDEIYERVWKEPAFQPENTVAVHIRRIREKIEFNPREPKYIKVVWGIGYKLEE
ncbi:response regulator transcription factor [Paenibacillus xylanexedens]|uniref:DNA-binding response OmpR family regulator n=1 Tax=Paenibacillus xylanexedens TaxID=528191 RepID=A0ABS4RXQ5_PAEXY|nr:response regulator transcription factor [Paenibacillus xylanexedens]MBP2247672.1 DNA-binding response OmpR family regulator [Paenibacillus xylanexedens]